MSTTCIRSTELLLLPGMLCDQSMWAPQSEVFATSLGVRVGDIGGARTIASVAGQVLSQAPPTFALAGLSMGGIVALEMWRQAPQRIERLALLDTNYRADPPERQRLRERQINEVQSGRLRDILRDELKPNYLAECHRDNTELLEKLLTMGQQLGETVFVNQSLALRDRPDSSTTLGTITCPTAVLCGAEDRLCPPALHKEMAARIPGATLTVIARCGHISTLEQPAQVTAALRAWLHT